MHLYPFPALFIGGEIVDLVRETGPVAQVVLLVLLRLQPYFLGHHSFPLEHVKRARSRAAGSCAHSGGHSDLQDMNSVSEQFRPSPLVGVFSLASRNSSAKSERPEAFVTRWPCSARCRSLPPRR